MRGHGYLQGVAILMLTPLLVLLHHHRASLQAAKPAAHACIACEEDPIQACGTAEAIVEAAAAAAGAALHPLRSYMHAYLHALVQSQTTIYRDCTEKV